MQQSSESAALHRPAVQPASSRTRQISRKAQPIGTLRSVPLYSVFLPLCDWEDARLTERVPPHYGSMIAASRYPAFSRNFDDEDEYVDAAQTALRRSSRSELLAPSLRWRRGFRAEASESKEGILPVAVKTLIVAFQGEGASFAAECFALSSSEWVGTLTLPSASASAAGGDTLDAADPLNSACNIFMKGGDLMVALSGYRVEPAVAHAWARELLDGISAEVVVCLAGVPLEPGRLEGWDGLRLLATTEAEVSEDCVKVHLVSPAADWFRNSSAGGTLLDLSFGAPGCRPEL